MTWVIIIGYTAVGLFAARKVFYAMRADDDGLAPGNGMDAAMVGFLALIVGFFWPLAIPVAIVTWKPRKTPAELRDEIAKRDARIAELEREAGIRR